MMIIAGKRVCSVCLKHLGTDNICPKHGPRNKIIIDAQQMHPIPHGKVHEGGALIFKGAHPSGKKNKKIKRTKWVNDHMEL